MKQKILIIVLAVVVIITGSCKDDGTGPENLEPGRRDYVWTVDTLKLPNGEFMSLYGIWGSEPNDVWACGSGSSNQYRLWHFNGTEWSNVDIGFSILDSREIYGFASNNIWLVTAGGVIAHYDGAKWISYANFSTLEEWLVLQGIWGKNANELYAFGFLDKKDLSGYTGCILRYDGRNWNYLEIEKLSLNFVTMGYDEVYEKYFVSAIRSEDGMQFIYELNGNKLTKLFESKEEMKVFMMGNRAYFMINKQIFKYNNGHLLIWKDFSANSLYAGVLNGRNEKDIFTINWGGVGHYNGVDVKMLFYSDFWFMNSIMFEKEVFIPSKDHQTGINAVIHGKLNN